MERLKNNIEFSLKKCNIFLNYEPEPMSNLTQRVEVDTEEAALNEIYLLKFIVAGGK
jgi:hypothetical protein